jgi:DNA-binding Xre family transcriptional regulator
MDNVLSTLVNEKIRKDRISVREASRQVGVSATTMSRVLEGESVDVDTLIMICSWLGVSPSHVLDAFMPDEGGLGAAFAAIIEANPRLAKAFGEAIERVISGEIPPDALRDVVAYANYRLLYEEVPEVPSDEEDLKSDRPALVDRRAARRAEAGSKRVR